MSEPAFLSKFMNFADNWSGDSGGAMKEGFYPEASNMITGSGWLTLGPGYRHYFANDKAYFDTSAAVSWHFYKMGQARVEMPELFNRHLRLGTQAMWADNTQVHYFGIGPDVSDDAESQYRLQTHDVVGYAIWSFTDTFYASGKFGWLGRPALMQPGGTFKPSLPTTQDVFPDDPAASLSKQPSFLHDEDALTSDTRNHRGHPTKGHMFRAALTNYWDRTGGTYTFHTWEAEGLEYIPLSDKLVVLALHGWTVYSNPDAGHAIPFYLMPSLGGTRTLRDYHNYQFHDNNLLVLNGEVRFGVWPHMDVAPFVDAGNVAESFGDLNLDKTSYGVGLRLHNDYTTFARLDFAWGPQGSHVIFTTSEPFRLPRVRRLLATIPFAP